jgi:hypothetical protein
MEMELVVDTLDTSTDADGVEVEHLIWKWRPVAEEATS